MKPFTIFLIFSTLTQEIETVQDYTYKFWMSEIKPASHSFTFHFFHQVWRLLKDFIFDMKAEKSFYLPRTCPTIHQKLCLDDYAIYKPTLCTAYFVRVRPASKFLSYGSVSDFHRNRQAHSAWPKELIPTIGDCFDTLSKMSTWSDQAEVKLRMT